MNRPLAIAPAPLIDAYFAARYQVRLDGGSVTLVFGGVEGGESATQRAWGQAGGWAIITGYNPMSCPRDAATNQGADEMLAAAIDAMPGLSRSRSIATDVKGGWSEPGWHVEGIDRTGTLSLARRFGQLATVFASRGRVGLLVTASEQWMPRRVAVHGGEFTRSAAQAKPGGGGAS